MIHSEDREFRLSQYLDGDLDPAEARALEGELERDESLRALLAQYRNTDRLIRSTAASAPEPDWGRFGRQVLGRCRGAGTANRRWAMLRIGVPLAAAAVLAIAFLFRTEFAPTASMGPGSVAENLELSSPPSESVSAETVVVSVVFDRTPPQGLIEEVPDEEESSYVIAAAGAGPLGGMPEDDEYAPTF